MKLNVSYIDRSSSLLVKRENKEWINSRRISWNDQCKFTLNRSISVRRFASGGCRIESDKIINGRFGKYGGTYVPELLITCLSDLEEEFYKAIQDEKFQEELETALRDYVGRETPLYFAERLTNHYKDHNNGYGPEIYLKREDLNHGGSHKINNALAQAMLAKRMGRTSIVTATGAGQHGVATAAACAKLGLNCTVIMGRLDIERQAYNVHLMQLLGAKVKSVDGTYKDASSQAVRDWVTNLETSYHLPASVIGPHPSPTIVREFQSIIGKEVRKQSMERWGGTPDVLVACIGGGSNSMGLFHEFIDDKNVRLIGVEAAGCGLESGKHSATLSKGQVGVYHGALSYLLQDDEGQIIGPHSIGVGEDLNHGGSHKINNALAQAMLAKRMGRTSIVTATGAGQHGVATAAACAKFGLNCTVIMGRLDIERQAYNVHLMQLLGAKVKSVDGTYKDASSQAVRDWVTNLETSYHLPASVIGPHPSPTIVREFQSIIGKEVRKQSMERWGGTPDVLVACIGGGSNSMGLFHEFIDDKNVRLIGVEAAGCGLESGKHSATLSKGQVGVYHGALSYLLQDDEGQIIGPHSIGVGLECPGVGPQLSYLKDMKRAEFHAVTDEDAVYAYNRLCRLEGIIPALETSHALTFLDKLCPTLSDGAKVVVNCSGRGDKDVNTVMNFNQLLEVKSIMGKNKASKY